MVALIVAPDIENIESKGGLNDMIMNLIEMAGNTGEYGEKKPVPVFFVLNRYALGRAILRKAPVACVAVLNYQGSDDNFKAMLEILPNLKEAYKDKLNDAMIELNLNLNDPNLIGDLILKTNPSHNQITVNDAYHANNSNVIAPNSGTIVSNQTRTINERMLNILSK